MASILKLDKIVDSGSNVLATSSGSGNTIDSGVTFPAGHVVQVDSNTVETPTAITATGAYHHPLYSRDRQGFGWRVSASQAE